MTTSSSFHQHKLGDTRLRSRLKFGEIDAAGESAAVHGDSMRTCTHHLACRSLHESALDIEEVELDTSGLC